MTDPARLTVRVADDDSTRAAAFSLRYEVFVTEQGGQGPLIDHAQRLERDRFDDHAQHLVLEDRGTVVGTLRMMSEAGAAAAGGFYSETEFDLSALRSSGRRLLELGRTCLHRDYRRSPGLMLLKSKVADCAAQTGVDLLIGAASLPGTDLDRLAAPLSWLWQNRLEAEAWRPEALGSGTIAPVPAYDRRAAVLQMPPLLKAYLKMGARVGAGAYVDHAFNCVDVLVMLDPARAAHQVGRERLTA